MRSSLSLLFDIKTTTLITAGTPTPDSALIESSVNLQIIFTQYNNTTDYTVLTGHWQFVKMLLKTDFRAN